MLQVHVHVADLCMYKYHLKFIVHMHKFLYRLQTLDHKHMDKKTCIVVSQYELCNFHLCGCAHDTRKNEKNMIFYLLLNFLIFCVLRQNVAHTFVHFNYPERCNDLQQQETQ